MPGRKRNKTKGKPGAGRPKIYAASRFLLALAPGVLNHIDRVLKNKETRSDLIREAIDRELRKRDGKHGREESAS